ncbi:hypothetical protein LQF12_02105 [Ruania suaedae]|uniref:hypothetical protein n=1 Tax=Ruania suaedae TaxID=2897774 RepID=UPI001E453D2C|nr:hypothetical protein [Ruania suaedae]UFU03425.1 hypothetical protein LQF12_02105 [Ruania suaedae]
MTDPVVLPPIDDEPKDGTYAPELLELELTEEEIAAGNALGEAIDPDDDEDGGS